MSVYRSSTPHQRPPRVSSFVRRRGGVPMADEEGRSLGSHCISVVILGDLHGHWELEDERYYATLPCDLLLWTGDLADSPGRQYAVAESLARCGPKAVGLLGNHD